MRRTKYTDLTEEMKAGIRTIYEEVRDDFRTAELAGVTLDAARRVINGSWPDATLEVVES